MNRRVLTLSAALVCVLQVGVSAQSPRRTDRPERAIRFDMPMTNSIQRAHAAYNFLVYWVEDIQS